MFPFSSTNKYIMSQLRLIFTVRRRFLWPKSSAYHQDIHSCRFFVCLYVNFLYIDKRCARTFATYQIQFAELSRRPRHNEFTDWLTDWHLSLEFCVFAHFVFIATLLLQKREYAFISYCLWRLLPAIDSDLFDFESAHVWRTPSLTLNSGNHNLANHDDLWLRISGNKIIMLVGKSSRVWICDWYLSVNSYCNCYYLFGKVVFFS